mmetsp:Transcript_12154/g.37040  ORF Transcript_12154/g.37040 Transcript_12154/m.37040 type:complete len:303 (+) Transcript_12154:190-1098(+)
MARLVVTVVLSAVLLPAVLGQEPLLGEVRMFAGTFAPRGWAFCDGQVLAISQNQALFSILGTTYGGDGRTTFALPDLRGRVPVHPGSGPGLTTRNQGAKFGSEEVSLAEANLPPHTHDITTNAGFEGADLTLTTNVDLSQVQTTGTFATISEQDCAVSGASITNVSATVDVDVDVRIPVARVANSRRPVGRYIAGSRSAGFRSNTKPGNFLADPLVSATASLGDLRATLLGGVAECGPQVASVPSVGLQGAASAETVAAGPVAVNVESVAGSVGSGDSINIVQPSLAINFIIATAGLFPSRA